MDHRGFARAAPAQTEGLEAHVRDAGEIGAHLILTSLQSQSDGSELREVEEEIVPLHLLAPRLDQLATTSSSRPKLADVLAYEPPHRCALAEFGFTPGRHDSGRREGRYLSRKVCPPEDVFSAVIN